MRFSERLRPPPLWWFVAVAFGLTFVIAVAAILPDWAVIASLLVAVAVIVGVLVGTTPVVRVTQDSLEAAGATLPASVIGTVTTLTGPRLRDRLGVSADPRAYLVYRAFCDAAVEVEVLDPADPHPYWLVSTRDPAALEAAITAAAASVTASNRVGE
jgi:hypothetical protein